MTLQAGIQAHEITDEPVDPGTAIDRVVARYAVASSPIKSRCYVALGCVFVAFAIVGLVLPGWPTVSWAVPAAFLFSLSNERLFRWSLANRFFGPALLRYYEQGKTLPRHAKLSLASLIALMSLLSAGFVFHVSYPTDPGFGPATILLVGLVGIWYVAIKLPTREG